MKCHNMLCINQFQEHRGCLPGTFVLKNIERKALSWWGKRRKQRIILKLGLKTSYVHQPFMMINPQIIIIFTNKQYEHQPKRSLIKVIFK